MHKRHTIRTLTILACLAMLTACATSPGESAAYVGLDEGWKRIRPFAEGGLTARTDLSESDRAFIRTTFDGHGRLIAELKGGAKAVTP